MAAEAAERNPDKNKYKALAAAAAVFSLLVFCVASRFVSYWTAAKGKREERGEEGREGSLPPFWCFSKSLRRQLGKKAARNN